MRCDSHDIAARNWKGQNSDGFLVYPFASCDFLVSPSKEHWEQTVLREAVLCERDSKIGRDQSLYNLVRKV
jgi:hypothetical protein